ncbi:MAG: helicase-exonuclease AddAB subunit AddA [Clostridia bacterium]|nr:helicase-exonuclease AddAB subunit AddA [Clostridia bacterium]
MELSHAQKQVINTKDKSLLVSASAGSGKTFVVIERIIESIKQGADVSRLLVLTFTNAAASELKERLVTSLYNLKDEYLSQGNKKEASRIAKQISRVPMSDISTIHSFCLNVIRNNFYSLGIDPNITTLDATKATIMLNEAITEVVEEEYEKREQEFLDVLDILGNEENLINTIYMLYTAYRNVLDGDAWLEDTVATYSTNIGTDLYNTNFGQVIVSSIKNRLKVLKLELEYMIDSLDLLDDFESRKDMLKVILNNINMAIETKSYDELFEALPQLLDMPRLPSTKVIDEELKEQVKALKTKASDELKDIANIMYKDSQGIIQELNETLKYITWYKQVVQAVDAKYTEAKKEKCSIDFADYEHLALKALEDENTRNKYTEKYEQIYIDEYQDTSNAQEAIIQKIAKENNVIMVGDVKQSIYAFRNAKPDLFTNKYDKLKDVEQAQDLKQAKIVLAQNFRSRKEVLNSTNDIFDSLMSKDFGGARYEDKEALVYGEGYDYSLEQDYKTEINIIEKEDDDVEKAQESQDENNEDIVENVTDIELEATLVAQKIRELVDSKFQVYDLKKKEYRDCKYKDIVILLRTVEGKADIVSGILSKYDIPCFADSKTGFYKSEEVTLITSFLKILDNPYDDISLVSVMYSIIGKFSLDELAVLRHKNTSKSVIETLKVSAEELEEGTLKNKINDFLELLERFKGYLKVYKISEMLLKLYNETGIYESLRSEKLGELKCANLDNFVQIVSEFEKGETATSLYMLIKYLNVLKSKESAGDSPKLLGENEDVVRIMTIHKSKGLEFPIVILMNTAAKYNEQDTKDRLQFDDELGIGIDIYNKDIGITYPSVIKQAIKAKTKRNLRSEALRLLYVALTRAKEKLIVYGTVPSLDKYMSKMMEIKNKETSEIIASGYNSHLKCMLQVALNRDKNFNVMLHKLKDLETISKHTEKLDRNKDKLGELKKAVDKFELKEDKQKIDKLKTQFITVKETSDINKKYTVTELKGDEDVLSELKPEILTTKVTGASYGTFIHSVIEHLDYNSVNKESVLNIVDGVANALDMQEKINKQYVVKDILDMYDTLKCYLENALSIKNELEFVIQDSLQEIPEVEFKLPTLIQGVVDMYVVTKGNKHIIIDFKTDKVETSKELVDRYSVQLKVYKKAIETAYNVRVDGTFIYSFGLKELIEV